jgi:hypothetical protein
VTPAEPREDSAVQSSAVLLLVLAAGGVVTLAFGLRSLLRRSNTQVHRINQ